MILAYVTICILQLNTCAREVPIQQPHFDTEEKCWDLVHEFMEQNGKVSGSPVTLTFRCGSDT